MPLNLVFEVSYLHFQHFLLFLNELHLHYFLFGFRPSCANLVLKSHHLFVEFLFLFINYFKLLLEFIPLRFEIVDFLLVMLKVSDSSLELLAFDLKWIESTIRNLFLIWLSLVNDGAHLIKVAHDLFVFLFLHFNLLFKWVVFHLLFQKAVFQLDILSVDAFLITVFEHFILGGKRLDFELQLLNNATVVIGRSSWDKTCIDVTFS